MEQQITKEMTRKVFTAKFNYSIPTEELKNTLVEVAPRYSTIPGCCWKIWLVNDDLKEAGGVYLFESAEDLEEYVNSSLFAAVGKNPAFSNLQTSSFDVVEAASKITDAPLLLTRVYRSFPVMPGFSSAV